MDNNKLNPEDKDVTVARLNFRQSILIALISAASGIIITLLSIPDKADREKSEVNSLKKENLYWVKITNVHIETNEPSLNKFRIYGDVGGFPITYPMKMPWASKNELNSSGSYPVYVEDKQGEFRFVLLALYKDSDMNYLSYDGEEQLKYDLEKLPFVTNVELTQPPSFSSEFHANAVITVEIRKNMF